MVLNGSHTFKCFKCARSLWKLCLVNPNCTWGSLWVVDKLRQQRRKYTLCSFYFLSSTQSKYNLIISLHNHIIGLTVNPICSSSIQSKTGDRIQWADVLTDWRRGPAEHHCQPSSQLAAGQELGWDLQSKWAAWFERNKVRFTRNHRSMGTFTFSWVTFSFWLKEVNPSVIYSTGKLS